jgi:hypothetical protein
VCLAKIYDGEALLTGGLWWLQMKSGPRLLYDDGEVKTEEQRLERPDLQDTLEPWYPHSTPVEEETRSSDPGRVRHLELLQSHYGDSEEAVRGHLTVVDVLGSRIVFHEKGAERLERVAVALRELVRNKPELARYFKKMGGGYSWRTIARTDRLSAHSFGIALDLNPGLGGYYQWTSGWNGNYPQEIVSIFEAEGFIWGGRWKHYDAMHFELRPELFAPECRQRN